MNLGNLLTGKRIEVYTAILLSLASLLAAWCAYQASAWSSEQATQAQTVARKRLEATRELTRGGQYLIVDAEAFGQWLQAQRSGDPQLAQFLRANFRDDFVPAFEAWLKLDPQKNPDAPTPFELPEYSPSQMDAAEQAEAEADLAAERFQFANNTSTAFVRETLFTAMTLFIGAIAVRFEYQGARLGLLGLATVIFILGLVTALALPMI
jgi:hypothetical protein